MSWRDTRRRSTSFCPILRIGRYFSLELNKTQLESQNLIFQGKIYWKQIIMYNNMLDTKPARRGEKTLMPDAVMMFNEHAEELMRDRPITILPSFKLSSGTFDCYHGADGLHPCTREALTEFQILLNDYCNELRVRNLPKDQKTPRP